ncbi:alpha/beta family hydrolase [Micropruina sonneratiae]|uniref:alpha/beta hydrolase family protein n=1 Tax=Micropruina sonneratiae TaxID=2986940 RepID=UPI00222616F7|nr:alpha/beta family hydrolase [Micropruina sp. KQZ13P-5]MCW3158347.1 hydrolase [Micropruina sp. KQZ13P-5]
MSSFTVPTPAGESRVSVHPAAEPAAVLLLGHGAGGGIDAFDLVSLAADLPGRGVTVALHEQPWKVAGKRMTTPPATLDQGWLPVLDAVLARHPGLPLWVGGRSAGARVACRCFEARQAGVVCLAFPLHPPGRSERSRIAELAGVTGPVLVIQGESDPFGSPDDVRAAALEAGGARPLVVAVPGAHSFGPRTKAARAGAAELRRTIVDAVAGFVLG